MQWLQEPNRGNLDNVSNASCEASRHFKNKKEGMSESQH